MDFVPVMAASALAPGAMTWVTVERERVLLAHVDGAFYALRDACGHRAMPLSKGRLDGHVVTCRWHDAKFDVRTGQVLAPGADIKPLKRYRVSDAGNGAVTVGEEL